MTKPPRVLNLNFIATAMLVLAAIFITYQFAALPQEIKGLAGMVLSAFFFALAYLVLTLDAHKAELAKLNTAAAMAADNARLDAAKAGMATARQLTASAWGGVSTTAGGDNRTADAAGAHRMNLELAAMNALANHALIEVSDAKALGARIRAAIDALLDKGAATAAGCTCGPSGACSNCPRNVPATKATADAVGTVSWRFSEGDPVKDMIQAKGENAARVTPEAVEATQSGKVPLCPIPIWLAIAAGKSTIDSLGEHRDELLRLVVAEWLVGLGYAEAIGLLEIEKAPR